jgi:hypothetical protein
MDTAPELLKWPVEGIVLEQIPTTLQYLEDIFPEKTESDRKATLGLWEGAETFDTGIYRPEFTCRMREEGADFCKVCKNTIANISRAKCPDIPELDVSLLSKPLRCTAGIIVRIPLPACVKCLTAVGQAAIEELALSGRDPAVVRIDIGPLPGVEKVEVVTVGFRGRTVVASDSHEPQDPSSPPLSGPNFSVSFPMKPGSCYYLEFLIERCESRALDFSIHLFLNDREVPLT